MSEAAESTLQHCTMCNEKTPAAPDDPQRCAQCRRPTRSTHGYSKPSMEEFDAALAAELGRREAEGNVPWYTKSKKLRHEFGWDFDYLGWLIGRFIKLDDTRVVLEKWNKNTTNSKSTWIVRWRDEWEAEQEEADD